MEFEIVGDVDKERIYCSGSFTKTLTTFVCLSHFSEQYDLDNILDDMDFLDRLCVTPDSKNFLQLFEKIIGSQFTIRDLCTFYSGLPYTFNVDQHELNQVEDGQPFKHHTIMDEKTLLARCKNNITRVHKDECKFHYSEISIIFLGYIVEKIYQLKIEDLYSKFIIQKFSLKNSSFSRTRIPEAYVQDLSDLYDYPSIAILDHGYFGYSNGFFTNLNDMKNLLEQLIHNLIFQYMVEPKNGRAASNRIMEGLTVEIREHGDDILYGYEGLSYSGTNIWAYSTKLQKGYLTTTNDEERAYDIYNLFGYENFDLVPHYSEKLYEDCVHTPHPKYPAKTIPIEYQGKYQRVRINEKELETLFVVGDHFIIIRNPTEIKYDLIFVNGNYRAKGKDGEPNSKIGLIESKNGKKYMYYDGTLYRKVK